MSRELAIIDLIAELNGQDNTLRDDTFWDPQSRLIYTTDMMIEGRHFKQDYFSPEDIGWKAAAANISDIASTGGTLKYLLISIGLPESIEMSWVSGFYQGLMAACQTFGGKIIGGDTVGSDQITINVTAIGECPLNHTPGHRYQAKAGDYVIATGFHGLSKVGMLALQQDISGYNECKSAHLRPTPRIREGLLLSDRFRRYAAMDSSDGLADALIKIAQTSQKKLVVYEDALPVHPEVAAYCKAHVTNNRTVQEEIRQTILYGGEDFELIATIQNLDNALTGHFKVIGRVGEPDDAPGAWLSEKETGNLQPLTLLNTYQHFEAVHD